MRKTQKMAFFLAFAIMICNSHNITLAGGKMLLLCDDRPPFHFVNSEGKHDGSAMKIIQCALEKTGQPYEIKMTPWKRAQVMTKDNKADGFFTGSKNAARDEYAQISDIVVDQHWCWVMLKNNPLDPNLESFKKKARTASWHGSNSLRWLEKNGYAVKATPNSVEALLKQLRGGRIDAAFGSDIMFYESIEKIGMKKENLKIVKQLYKPWGVHISKKFLEKNSGFMEKFNAAIGECMSKE